MKTIRNKLIFKAFQAKEAAREKGLMLKANCPGIRECQRPR